MDIRTTWPLTLCSIADEMSDATALYMGRNAYEEHRDDPAWLRTYFIANGMATALNKCVQAAPARVMREAYQIAFPREAVPRDMRRQMMKRCCEDDEVDFPGMVAQMTPASAAVFLAPLRSPDPTLTMADNIGYHSLRELLAAGWYKHAMPDFCEDAGVKTTDELARLYLKRARDPALKERLAKRRRMEVVEQEVVEETDADDEDVAAMALVSLSQ